MKPGQGPPVLYRKDALESGAKPSGLAKFVPQFKQIPADELARLQAIIAANKKRTQK
jgi:hypothetical protein